MSTFAIIRRITKTLLGRPWPTISERLASGQNLLNVAARSGALTNNDRQRSPQATLQIGVAADGGAERQAASGIANCLFWCPFGFPTGHTVAPVCSRLGKRLRSSAAIAAGLRTLVINLDHTSYVISGHHTTLDEPLRRACQLFSKTVFTVQLIPRNPSVAWIINSLNKPSSDVVPIYVYPPEPAAIGRVSRQHCIDQVVFALADDLRVLYVRAAGNLFRLITERLERQKAHAGKTFLMLDPTLDDAQTKRELIERGGVGWWLYDQRPDPRTPRAVPTESNTEPAQWTAPIVSITDFESDDFLAHCTRSIQKHWPDEIHHAPWDNYLFGRDSEAAGPLITLCRILSQRRLLATTGLIRDPQPVVCLTEIPLSEISNHRSFQPHLSRWDFEPFGVSLHRTVLQQKCGAQPVIYGDDSTWRNLTVSQRPYFQWSGSGEKSDWTREREWRVVGDIDLRLFSDAEMVVFVPDEPSARIVAKISVWPVVIVGPAVQRASAKP